MANAVVEKSLGGVMVWFASVYDSTNQKPAFTYSGDDATSNQYTTGSSWASAMQTMSLL